MSTNTYIKRSYSQGTACIAYSFYKTNLSLRFTPWVGKSDFDLSEYDKTRSIYTTISDENASALYYLAKRIVDGKVKKPIQFEIPCNNDVSIIFDYYPERATLMVEKQGERILFEFVTHRYKERDNGKIEGKTIHSGLIAFMKILEAYLTAISSDRVQYNQFGEVYNAAQNYPPEWM